MVMRLRAAPIPSCERVDVASGTTRHQAMSAVATLTGQERTLAKLAEDVIFDFHQTSIRELFRSITHAAHELL